MWEVDNDSIVRECIINCLHEMYKWAQPSLNFKDYLLKGGHRDTYIEGKDGMPGYRGSEETLPITSFLNKEDSDKIAKLLDDCTNFYRFDRNYDGVSSSISLGPSPTCNKESVINYWKTQGKDITIEDFDVEDKIYGTYDDEEEE